MCRISILYYTVSVLRRRPPHPVVSTTWVCPTQRARAPTRGNAIGRLFWDGNVGADVMSISTLAARRELGCEHGCKRREAGSRERVRAEHRRWRGRGTGRAGRGLCGLLGRNRGHRAGPLGICEGLGGETAGRSRLRPQLVDGDPDTSGVRKGGRALRGTPKPGPTLGASRVLLPAVRHDLECGAGA